MSTFKHSADESGVQANAGYTLNFYHLASNKEVKFKGFVTNFSDQYQSSWDKEEIFGRMDPIQTFKSTQRTINVSWDVVAGSLAEAKDNLEKLSTLFNMLYPSYETKASGTAGMTHAPLLRMKYLNFVTKAGASAKSTAKEGGLLGSSSGFNFEPAMDDAMYGDDAGNLYPKVVKLSCTFSVIHESALGWIGKTGNLRTGKFPYSVGQAQSPAPGPSTTPADTNSPKKSQQAEQRDAQKAQSILDDFKNAIQGGGGVRK
jgi:hypothetical protein